MQGERASVAAVRLTGPFPPSPGPNSDCGAVSREITRRFSFVRGSGTRENNIFSRVASPTLLLRLLVVSRLWLVVVRLYGRYMFRLPLFSSPFSVCSALSTRPSDRTSPPSLHSIFCLKYEFRRCLNPFSRPKPRPSVCRRASPPSLSSDQQRGGRREPKTAAAASRSRQQHFAKAVPPPPPPRWS